MVFLRLFLRVLLFGKYFFVFSVNGKVLFWVVQKYPTLLIPVCRFFKSTPWEIDIKIIKEKNHVKDLGVNHVKDPSDSLH